MVDLAVISQHGLGPESYKDWKLWARALLVALTKPKENVAIFIPQYPHARKPNPTVDGMLIFVIDDSQGKVPIYSKDNDWYRFDGTFAEPPVDVTLPASEIEFTTGTWSVTVV